MRSNSNNTETRVMPKRNDPCWCGSGKKYKKCHWKEDTEEMKTLSQPVKPTPRIIRRSEEYVEGMRAACKLAKQTLNMLEPYIKPGITTEYINKLVHEYTLDHNATPAPLNYHGFPKSVCTSLNDVICHGIPSEKAIIKEGDLLNIDVTSILNGYYGDTNRTFLIGECTEEAKKLTEVTKRCLELGIEAVKPYGHIGDIGAAIEKYAHQQGFSVVEKFVGHEIGDFFHGEIQIPHYGKKGTGPMILPGMFFTIEPMINAGTKDLRILDDGWTAITKDGRLSAQFEHTLMVTEKGVDVLTA